MSKRTRIDASREARLWLKEVLLPAGALIVTAISIPEVRNTGEKLLTKSKDFIESKFKRN